MKPQKAIEIIESLIETLPGSLSDKERAALKLGIEALKFSDGLCEGLPLGFYTPLPGETEE